MTIADKPRPFLDIAERLKQVRSVLDMDGKEMAKDIGVGYTQYKNWESGAFRIGLTGAKKLKKRHGISLDYIYDGEFDSLPMSWRKALSEVPSDNA